MNNLILKFIWEGKRTRRAKSVLKKKGKIIARITQLNLKNYCKVTVIKIMWY